MRKNSGSTVGGANNDRKTNWTGIIALVLFFLVCLGAALYVSRNVLMKYPVEGDSMETTIHNGDDVLLVQSKKIRRGDIVVFKSDEFNKCLIKRVIGLEGDTIAIKYSAEDNAYYIYRNGEKLTEDYIKEPMNRNYEEAEYVVGKGEFFFLGDNRNVSLDSHARGMMGEISGIEGIVFVRYKGWDIDFISRGKR